MDWRECGDLFDLPSIGGVLFPAGGAWASRRWGDAKKTRALTGMAARLPMARERARQARIGPGALSARPANVPG